MNSNVLVSVVIPTYKRPDKLDVAIKSVLQQSYPNVEVIVVDDNDPDMLVIYLSSLGKKSLFRSSAHFLDCYFSPESYEFFLYFVY